ncbi:hypothetical protein BU15DRAFT_64283 [Melanogaster broomeanus]|nr:hypothetical protein BU15DRAFT_64283 [Melanogaster broomeanus]
MYSSYLGASANQHRPSKNSVDYDGTVTKQFVSSPSERKASFTHLLLNPSGEMSAFSSLSSATVVAAVHPCEQKRQAPKCTQGIHWEVRLRSVESLLVYPVVPGF